jgi:predicted dehydrogenase
MLRIGMVAVNTPHAPIYARLLWDPDAPGAPSEPQARITTIWDEDPHRAAEYAREHRTEVVATPEGMIGVVDAVMIIERDQRKHAAQAIPFLRAGIPTFINKPLADDMADALTIAAVARETRTPIFSTSALRFDPEVLALKARIEQTGPVRVAVSVGYRELMYYGVHAVEMLVTALGPGVDWVENRTASDSRDVIHAQYSNGTTALVLVLRDTAQVFHLTTFGERGVDRAIVADTSRNPMFADETRAFLRMVRTGEVPVKMDETLEVTRILCAARESGQNDGRRVYLRDLG